MKNKMYLITCNTEIDEYAYIEYSDKKPKIQDYENIIELSNQLDDFLIQFSELPPIFSAWNISGLEKFEIKFNPKFPVPEIEK